MKKLLLAFIISQSSFILFANQQPILDSLYTLWLDESQSIKIRADAMFDFAWDGYMYSHTDSAIYFGEQLLEFTISNDYKVGTSRALSLLGVANKNLGNYPKALDYYQRSLKIKEEIGNKVGIPSVLTNIGSIYMVQGNLDKALEYNLKSLEIKEELGDRKGLSTNYVNIGNIYFRQQKFDDALEYFNKSLKLKEEFNDSRGIALCLLSVGSTYEKQGLTNEAYDQFRQALTSSVVLGDKYLMADANYRIGQLFYHSGDYNKAIKNCEEAYNLASESGYVVEKNYACNCLYDSYKALKNNTKALEYHEQMLELELGLHKDETAKKLQLMEFQKTMLQDSIVRADEARLMQEAHEEAMHAKERNTNISLSIGGLVLLLAGGLYSRLHYVRKSKAVLQVEKDRSENLLLNILPEEIAQELKEKGKADARDFDMVSILFTDFKEFTQTSEKLTAAELVNEINHCFEAFDGIIEKYKIEKIKTIGDAYMAAGGLPVPTDNSVNNTVSAALEMQTFITQRKAENDALGNPFFEMRVGIHTGPVVAGIVGVKKFQYDIWGDTVNTASRMESSGAVGKVNVSQSTYELLKDDAGFAFESRGKIEAKGKGEMEMYFVMKTS